MLKVLKKIIKSTPIKSIYDRMLQRRYEREIASISSKDPVYPLYCLSCRLYFKKFNPLSPFWAQMFEKTESVYDIHQSETLNIENYSCPRCHINDRDRLYGMYLRQRIDPSLQYKLIEFAPTYPLAKVLKEFKNVNRRTCNLLPDDVDDTVDIMDMHIYEDERFDIFICSHILEHVDDDLKAMRELYRILKPRGFGIAMVPINYAIKKTFEDPSIQDENLRWKYFGQGDHVRSYEKQDYINRLESVGFKVKQLGKDYFGEKVFQQNGITETSVLYVVEK